MYSKFQSFDDINQVHLHAQRIKQEISDLGISVLRIKIECLASNGPKEPQNDGYFEFHWKLFLIDNEKLNLKEILKSLNLHSRLHLSRNSFKKIDSGEQIYLTLRNYDGGYEKAIQEFDSVCQMIARYKVLKFEREYVLYDSNFELDAGWKSAVVE
ncbi:hypothetical protein HDV04_005993 [Boothiomyces sp. JEL0838]|nr:hypothetical protein HDV04_005993 [Boothiomyces sp. JEL0838]